MSQKTFINILQIAREINRTAKFYAEEGIDLTYVPDMEQKLRIALCKGCPEERFNKWTRQCKECKCFMDFKTKLKFDPVESGKNNKKTLTVCPMGFW